MVGINAMAILSGLVTFRNFRQVAGTPRRKSEFVRSDVFPRVATAGQFGINACSTRGAVLADAKAPIGFDRRRLVDEKRIRKDGVLTACVGSDVLVKQIVSDAGHWKYARYLESPPAALWRLF